PDAAAIVGTVTDAQGLSGIAQAAVRAGAIEGTTCADGTYRLRVPVDPNGYLVSAGGSRYSLQTWNGTAGGTPFACEGAAVSGAGASGIDFPLSPGAAIEGTIASGAQGCADDLGAGGLTIDDGSDHACSLGEPDPNAPASGFR